MTTFGKKNAAGAQPQPAPAFGRKTTEPAAQRKAAPASSQLSPEALAFLQSERSRVPEQPVKTAKPGKPAGPSYSSSSVTDQAGAGKPVWGRRVIARFVDELGMWFLIFLLLREPMTSALNAHALTVGTPSEGTAVLPLLGFALLFLIGQAIYNIAMEASSLQATLGKMLVGAVVTARDGSKPSLRSIIIRNTVARLLVNVVPFCIGYLMGLASSERRCLHDIMANTVVRKRVAGAAVGNYGEVFA